MPIYEYLCESCGNVFDELRQMVDSDKPIDCSRCSSKDTKRKISSFYAHGQHKIQSSGGSGCGNCSGKSCTGCSRC